MSKAILTTEPISANQIQEWKSLYKSVYEIEVSAPDEIDAPGEAGQTLKGYFRRPTIDELATATSAAKDNMLKSSITIYNTCLLGGHPAFKEDEEVKLSALQQFGDVIKAREATLKKL